MTDLRTLVDKAHDEAIRLRIQLAKTDGHLWAAKELLLETAALFDNTDQTSFEHINNQDRLHRDIRTYLLTIPDVRTVADRMTSPGVTRVGEERVTPGADEAKAY